MADIWAGVVPQQPPVIPFQGGGGPADLIPENLVAPLVPGSNILRNIVEINVLEYVVGYQPIPVRPGKTVYGIDVIDYQITDENVGVEFFISESGISSGNVNNPIILVTYVLLFPNLLANSS